MTTTSERQVVPVAQEEFSGARDFLRKAGLRDSNIPKPDRLAFDCIARTMDDYAAHRLAPLPCKSGEGAGALPYATSISLDRAIAEVRGGNMQMWSGAILDHLRNYAALTPDATQTREAELLGHAFNIAAKLYPGWAEMGITAHTVTWDTEIGRGLTLVDIRDHVAALNARGDA